MTEAAAPLTVEVLAEQMSTQFAAMQGEIDRLRQENSRLHASMASRPPA